MLPPPPKLSRAPVALMLALAALLVAVIAYLAYRNDRSYVEADAQANLSRRVDLATEELLDLLRDAETGQRGYLLTGRESYLAPYEKAVAAAPAVIRNMRETLAARPDQMQRVEELQPWVDRKLREMAATIQVRRAEGLAAALRIVETDEGRQLMTDIRARCSVIRQVAARRVIGFEERANTSAAHLRAAGTVGGAALLGMIVLLSIIVFRSLDYRESLYHQAALNAEQLRVTISSIGDAVIATDADRNVTLINPIAQELTGWTDDQAQGYSISSVFQIVEEDTRNPLPNPLEQAINTGNAVGLANHAVLISKSGRETPIDDSAAPIRDARQKIVGGILVFRDISRRRGIERQLRASNQQLKDFVDAAAHDLRTPLRSINMFAELLVKRSGPQLTPDAQSYLGTIQHGVQRMSRLLEDLVTYAQATQFDRPEDLRSSMKAALRTVLENLRGYMEAERAEVTSDLLPVLPVYSIHLVQLLQNLIENAIKYRSQADPRIHISCHQADNSWLIQVKDNGIGIEPEYREEIFKPFKRLHGEDRPGSGVGLATCQKIVNGYGGLIWVESAPREGSIFFFTLPLSGS